MNRSFAIALTTLLLLLAGCIGASGTPSPIAAPEPSCGGIKVRIDGALACRDVAQIALDTLRDRAPAQLARGVAAIEVSLATCPRNEVPPQIRCGQEQFVQLVKVTFRDSPNGGLVEPSLTVAVAPVSGAILGIANPLIR
jgi:hypothetical protein